MHSASRVPLAQRTSRSESWRRASLRSIVPRPVGRLRQKANKTGSEQTCAANCSFASARDIVRRDSVLRVHLKLFPRSGKIDPQPLAAQGYLYTSASRPSQTQPPGTMDTTLSALGVGTSGRHALWHLGLACAAGGAVLEALTIAAPCAATEWLEDDDDGNASARAGTAIVIGQIIGAVGWAVAADFLGRREAIVA